MRATTIPDQSSLEALPDGTIISWLRIPGDCTSTAVAFVCVEHTDGLHGEEETVIWVSPGGWDPMTLDDAGITYPAEIIRWGEVSVNGESFGGHAPVSPLLTAPAWPEYPAFSEIPPLTGGTWAREKALECASQLWAPAFGAAQNPDRRRQTRFSELTEGHVLVTADAFERWLDRDDDDETAMAFAPNDQAQTMSTDLSDIWNDLDPEPDLNSRWLAAELIKRGWHR